MSLSNPSFFYRFRVSQFSHYSICPKRCKLEVFNQVEKAIGSNKWLVKGTEMHERYNSWAKSFDRMKVLYDLKYNFKRPYTKTIDNIQLRGQFDDLRVIRDTRSNQKYVSFVELKTTSKQRMWNVEVEAAVFQLQLYLTIMESYIKALGYQMHKHHYLEIYSQQTGRLLKRIMVQADLNIDNRVRYILRAMLGLERWTYPPEYVCRLCPKSVKSACWLYQERKKK